MLEDCHVNGHSVPSTIMPVELTHDYSGL